MGTYSTLNATPTKPSAATASSFRKPKQAHSPRPCNNADEFHQLPESIRQGVMLLLTHGYLDVWRNVYLLQHLGGDVDAVLALYEQTQANVSNVSSPRSSASFWLQRARTGVMTKARLVQSAVRQGWSQVDGAVRRSSQRMFACGQRSLLMMVDGCQTFSRGMKETKVSLATLSLLLCGVLALSMVPYPPLASSLSSSTSSPASSVQIAPVMTTAHPHVIANVESPLFSVVAPTQLPQFRPQHQPFAFLEHLLNLQQQDRQPLARLQAQDNLRTKLQRAQAAARRISLNAQQVHTYRQQQRQQQQAAQAARLKVQQEQVRKAHLQAQKQRAQQRAQQQAALKAKQQQEAQARAQQLRQQRAQQRAQQQAALKAKQQQEAQARAQQLRQQRAQQQAALKAKQQQQEAQAQAHADQVRLQRARQQLEQEQEAAHRLAQRTHVFVATDGELHRIEFEQPHTRVSPSTPAIASRFASMNLKALRNLLHKAGVSTRGFVEKDQLVMAALKHFQPHAPEQTQHTQQVHSSRVRTSSTCGQKHGSRGK